MTDSTFIKGIIPPLVTPIDKDEKIDEKKLRSQVSFVIENGVHGILAFGSNGEFYMVEEDEYMRGIKIFVDESRGRVPIFLGIGAINTNKCIRLAKMGFDMGANAVSILQPMFLKPTEEELYKHFAAIAKAVEPNPMLLYNNPGRAGYTLSSDLVYRLCHDFQNIVGIKDSSGDMTQLEEFVRRNRDVGIKVLGGKDTLIYGAMAHGAVGAIASTANYVPKLVLDIYNQFMKGDHKSSLEAQFQLNPIRLLTDKTSFPVGTKDVTNIVGRNVGSPYLPNLLTKNPPVIEAMEKEIERLKAKGII